jgi:hypothetical protein
MSVRRKFSDLLTYLNPFSANLASPPKDEDIPARKRPRLEASTSISTAEDAADTVTYKKKARPSTGPCAREPYRKWTAEEDAKLIEVVKECGQVWARVAALVPGRNSQQCSQRWRRYLDDTICRETTTFSGKWTAKEDTKLIKAVRELGNDWATIAALVPDRSDEQCSTRWHKHLVPIVYGTTAPCVGKWTVEEDAKLIEAVRELGKDWTPVATRVPGRSQTQCANRWGDYLDLATG